MQYMLQYFLLFSKISESTKKLSLSLNQLSSLIIDGDNTILY